MHNSHLHSGKFQEDHDGTSVESTDPIGAKSKKGHGGNSYKRYPFDRI
jgi:hypothetical protein